MTVGDNHPQTSFAQLWKNGAVEVQFDTIYRRRTPLNTVWRSRGCCIINESLLALLKRCKGLHGLLKDLDFGKEVGAYTELISPVPNGLHHRSHKFHTLSFLMRCVDQFRDV